ncbi:MAG: hypothetical protein J5I41_07165, partial [Saprospiraceae bacterium]|nr:hypothetical protein [Saprospiraceae bacterium]
MINEWFCVTKVLGPNGLRIPRISNVLLTALTRVLPLLAVHVLSTVIQPVWAQPVFTRADSL